MKNAASQVFILLCLAEVQFIVERHTTSCSILLPSFSVAVLNPIYFFFYGCDVQVDSGVWTSYLKNKQTLMSERVEMGNVAVRIFTVYPIFK